jgi:hypothetical protein
MVIGMRCGAVRCVGVRIQYSSVFLLPHCIEIHSLTHCLLYVFLFLRSCVCFCVCVCFVRSFVARWHARTRVAHTIGTILQFDQYIHRHATLSHALVCLSSSVWLGSHGMDSHGTAAVQPELRYRRPVLHRRCAMRIRASCLHAHIHGVNAVRTRRGRVWARLRHGEWVSGWVGARGWLGFESSQWMGEADR